MKQLLKGRAGETLGFIVNVSDNRVELHDRNGKVLGFYNPKLDRTFSQNGAMIGTGNLLTTLLNSH